jgi:hypothetical protein
MPKPVSTHVAVRLQFRDTVKDAVVLNERLEAVIAIKSKGGSSEVFHGKIDHSTPPWNTSAANLIMELHAAVRDLEGVWQLRAGLSLRVRGGSTRNTLKAFEALTRLSEAVDDTSVINGDRQLSGWCRRASAALGDSEAPKRLPRVLGEREAVCPWCKRDTLRQMALAGIVFCCDPSCTDEEGRRPKAQLEYFDSEWVLRWMDGILGNP